MASLIGAYLFTKEISSKAVATLCVFLLSVSGILIYLNTAILTDIPSFAIFTFGVYFFYRYIKSKQPRHLYLACLIFGLGTLIRISLLPMILLIPIYFLKKEIKLKEALISSGIFIGVLIPYIIYGFIVYNGFVFTGAAGFVAPMNYISEGFANIMFYINILLKYTFLIGFNYQMDFVLLIIIFFALIVWFNKLNEKDNKSNEGNDKSKDKLFYLLMIFLIPFLSTSFIIGHGEERYIINCLLGTFLLISLFLIYIYNIMKTKQKLLAYLFIILVVLLFGTIQIRNEYIRLTEFDSSYIKEAGLWAKDNLRTAESCLSTNPMQISYYSGIYIYRWPSTKEELDEILSQDNIKCLIVFKSEEIYMNKDFLKKDLIVLNSSKEFTIYRYP